MTTDLQSFLILAVFSFVVGYLGFHLVVAFRRVLRTGRELRGRTDTNDDQARRELLDAILEDMRVRQSGPLGKHLNCPLRLHLGGDELRLLAWDCVSTPDGPQLLGMRVFAQPEPGYRVEIVEAA